MMGDLLKPRQHLYGRTDKNEEKTTNGTTREYLLPGKSASDLRNNDDGEEAGLSSIQNKKKKMMDASRFRNISERKVTKLSWKGRVYNFLERPKGWTCFAYHFSVFVLVLGCLILSVLSTVELYAKQYSRILFVAELFLVIFFGVEYGVRLWSADCCSKYRGWYGRLRYACKPIALIDLAVVSASVFVIVSGMEARVFATSAVRGLRFLQILRMLHVDRQGGSWKLLGSVIFTHRQELITTLYIGFLGLIFSSYFVYLAEKGHVTPDGRTSITTYADALWWAVVTLTTIGYGDVLIVTWPGRVVASCFAIFAISFFALPAGILGSGFALEVQQKQRKKHFSRKMAPAATLIQTCWRCYAADKSNRYSATWAIYVKPQQKKDDDDLGKNNGGNTDNKVTNRKQNKFFKKAGSNFNVFQKYQSSTATASDEADKKKDIKKKASLIDSKSEEQENEMEESLLALPLSFAHVNELTEVHKNVIRAIRKIKYFVARRGFQQIKKPYDIRDIIEQYSQGHINMMARIKELQRRLDQTLGKTGHQLNNGKRIQSTTIGSRITRVELQLNSLDHKLDNCQHIMQSVCRMLQQDRLPPRHSLPTYGLSGPPLLIHDSTNYQDPESMHQSMSSLAPSMAESVSISIANSPKSSMGGESNTYKLTEFPSSEGECSNSSRCRVNSE